jgi:sugar phosphate isomerase/epimerase
MWVFHPGLKTGISMFYPGMEWVQNRETVHLLCNVAADYGVKIAIENVPEPFPFVMKSVEDFARFYKEINEDIGMVLDVGHANINGQIEDFLKTFSKNIVHIHAHDNDGKGDQHMGIGYGTVEWQKVVKTLKRMDYRGVVVVESVEHVQESVNKLKQLST